MMTAVGSDAWLFGVSSVADGRPLTAERVATRPPRPRGGSGRLGRPTAGGIRDRAGVAVPAADTDRFFRTDRLWSRRAAARSLDRRGATGHAFGSPHAEAAVGPAGRGNPGDDGSVGPHPGPADRLSGPLAARGLAREVTGQGRYRVWAAAV